MHSNITNAYATAFLKSLDKNNGQSRTELFEKLAQRAHRHGHSKLLPAISRAILRGESTFTPTITYATEKDRTIHQENCREKASSLTNGEVIEKIDTTLVGGWRIESKSRLVDTSYRLALINLYKSLTSQHG